MSFPGYLADDEVSALKRRLSEVADLALDRRLTLLFGAGFSKDARGLPTGAELASMMLETTYGCDETIATRISKEYELAAIAQQFTEHVVGRNTQLVTFVTQKLQHPDSISTSQKDFATIASICRLRRVFTTNFDDLLETALGPRHRLVKPTIASIREFENESRTRDCTGIFHLNGDLGDPQVTEDQLRSHRSPFFEQLRHELVSNLLVMIGYSFRDDAITTIYGEISELLRAVRQDRQNCIVMPIRDRYEYMVAQKIWDRRCNVILLPMLEGDFLHELLLSVQEARYGASVKDIAGILSQPEEHVKDLLRPLRERYSELGQDDVAEVYRQILSVRHI